MYFEFKEIVFTRAGSSIFGVLANLKLDFLGRGRFGRSISCSML